MGANANVTSSGNPVVFGTTELGNTNTDGGSSFIVKYDNTGKVLWAKSLNSPDESYATKIALDTFGNVYVKGGFRKSMRIGSTNLVSMSQEDMFIAKFDTSGALIWVRQEVGSGGEGGVAVDQGGNVYVTGAFGGTVNIGGTTLTNAGNWDAFVAKYTSDGSIQWARRAGKTNLDFYWDTALDEHGNVYVGGVLGSSGIAPNGSDATVAKYNPSGTLQWAVSATGPSVDPISSITAKCAVDAPDDCYVAGWYRKTTTFGTHVLKSKGYWNYFLAKVGFTPLTLGITWSNAMPLLSISGNVSNPFALEYVTALTSSNHWRILATNTVTSNSFMLLDRDATGSLSRYYRVRLLQ